jgi:hypothetical protein
MTKVQRKYINLSNFGLQAPVTDVLLRKDEYASLPGMGMHRKQNLRLSEAPPNLLMSENKLTLTVLL